MKHRSISIVAVAGAVMLASSFAVGAARAQEPPRCLDNSGGFSVAAGVQYADANGAWECAPGSPAASAGGWVRLDPTPTLPEHENTINAGPAPVKTSITKVHGHGVTPFVSPAVWAAGAAGAFVVAILATVVARKRQAPRLNGSLQLREVRRAQR